MRAQNDIAAFHTACFLSAFEQGDEAGMQFKLTTPHGTIADILMLENAAWVQVYYGHIQQASALFLKSKTTARKTVSAGFYAQVLDDIALEEVESGLLHQAREDAEEAIRQDPQNALIRAYAALALARVGDISRAEVLASETASQTPSNTIVVNGILPCVQSAIRLAKGDTTGAVLVLNPARPLDFSSFLSLAPAYYRGVAYQKNHQLEQPTVEFQRVIDHRSIFPTSPYVILSRLELGRTLMVIGSRTLAEREFSDLRTIWATADSAFPPRQMLEASSSLPMIPNH